MGQSHRFGWGRRNRNFLFFGTILFMKFVFKNKQHFGYVYILGVISLGIITTFFFMVDLVESLRIYFDFQRNDNKRLRRNQGKLRR